jgi:hypothetical protein
MAYTPEQIQQAMRRAIQAGDQQAVAEMRGMLQQAYRGEVRPVSEEMGTGARVLAGVGRGMENIGRQAGNIVGLQDDAGLQRLAETDADLLSTTGGKVGNFIGEVAATAPLGGLAAGGARAAGAGLIRAGMAEGAAQGALTAGPGNRLGGAATGAAFGAVLPGAARAVQRFARPMKATAEASRLVNRGVNLTPGELNPTGKLAQWEQALQSSAVGGAKIQEARAGAMRDFQRAVAQSTGPENMAPLRGRDVNRLVQEVQDAYGQGYEGAIGGYNQLTPSVVRTAGGNVPLPRAMQQAASATYPGRLITPEMRKQMSGAMVEEVGALPANQFTTGRGLQGVRSNLRSMARDTDVPGERALLRGGERRITEALESQISPADAAKLRALDSRYGRFKVLQDVTRRGGDQPGGWTPAQLSQSVRAASDLGEYATGGGGRASDELRRLSQAGRKVFEQRSMPTGERQVTTGLLGRVGTPVVASALNQANKLGAKRLTGKTAAQRKVAALVRRLRRKRYRSDLQAGEALGTATMIEADKEGE